MVTIGRTMCPHVVRVVDKATFRICWAVESTYATPDQGERVDYVVSHGGVTQLSGSATTYERQQPEFSTAPSRMPGVASGQAPIRCYSLNMPLSTLPRGELTVTATARGHDGTSVAIEQVVVWNDETGVQDSRPSTAVIHWKASTGNNANNGSSSSLAVRDLLRAIQLASVGGNCGGATIIAHENVTGNGNAGGTSGFDWQTGEHWLTIEAATPGINWRAQNAPSTNLSTGAGGDAIRTTTPSAGQQINIRFLNIVGLGGGLTCYDTSGHQGSSVTIWWEGGEWGSVNWDDNGPRVRCLEDIGSSAGGPMNIEGFSGRKGRYYVTGVLSRGVGIGFTSHDLVYDCEIRDHIGGTLYAAGWPTAKAVFHSVIADRHNYSRNLTRGWGCNRQGEITDLQPLESQDMGGGIMRILGPVGGYRFDLAFADNVDSLRTRLGIRAWPGVGTDQTGRIIRGTGTTGGRPYVDIEHTGTYGAAPAGAEIETVVEWNPGGGSWEWFNVRIHPSSLSRPAGSNRDTVIFRDIAPFNSTQEVQSHFSNGTPPITNLLIDNVRDAGTGANWNMSFGAATVGYTNCLIRRVTAAASGTILSSGPSYAGSQMTNCVFKTAPAAMAGMISGGFDIAYNHFVDDNAGQTWHGASASYGAYYGPGSSHGADPWTFTPLSIGNGDPRAPEPGGLAWSNLSSTKGCLPDVAGLDWSLPAAGGDVLMDGAPIANTSVSNPAVQFFTSGVAFTHEIADENELTAYEGLSFGAFGITIPTPMQAGTFGTTGQGMVGMPISNADVGNPVAGTFTAGVAMQGTAAADITTTAPAGTIEAQVLFTGAAIDDVEVENPTGDMESGAVLFIGTAIDDMAAQAPAGDLFAHALMQGTAMADVSVQAPAGDLFTGAVLQGSVAPMFASSPAVDVFGAEDVPEEPEEPEPPAPVVAPQREQKLRPWSPPPLARRPWRIVR